MIDSPKAFIGHYEYARGHDPVRAERITLPLAQGGLEATEAGSATASTDRGRDALKAGAAREASCAQWSPQRFRHRARRALTPVHASRGSLRPVRAAAVSISRRQRRPHQPPYLRVAAITAQGARPARIRTGWAILTCDLDTQAPAPRGSSGPRGLGFAARPSERSCRWRAVSELVDDRRRGCCSR
jgi:hypothetical protein